MQDDANLEKMAVQKHLIRLESRLILQHNTMVPHGLNQVVYVKHKT